MANLLVVGTVNLDSVKTPFGQVEEVLGGSASFFAAAASYFAPVRMVGVVGEDFPKEHLEFFRSRPIDVSGLQTLPGKTFRWRGEYGYDLNEAKTLATELNVLAQFRPILPASHTDSPFVFLANIDPDIQREVLYQMPAPTLVAMDTMNFWIEGKREALLKTLGEVDVLAINEAEARQLTQEPNLVKAARAILSFGPRVVAIKRGEYGAMLFTNSRFFFVPAYPLESVFDPTGAGDTFAGGFMGYLAKVGEVNEAHLRRALVYGSVMASFTVEQFSLNRLRTLTLEEIDQRFLSFQEMVEIKE